MRLLAISVAAVILLAGLPMDSNAGDRHRTVTYAYDRDHDHDDYWDFDLDDGSIIMTHHEGRYEETVEITEGHDLYVNDVRIDLNEDQQKLVSEFYDLAIDMVDYAKEIGWEGAKIGASGAKLGLTAIGRLCKVMFTDYDTEDFERDMEREAEKLEARAEELEEKAEEIEDMAEELQDIAYEMSREIPELEELDWF